MPFPAILVLFRVQIKLERSVVSLEHWQWAAHLHEHITGPTALAIDLVVRSRGQPFEAQSQEWRRSAERTGNQTDQSLFLSRETCSHAV